MRFQTILAKRTWEAVDSLFRNARAVPADKLEWVPMGCARTVLDQLQECATAPLWMGPILVNKVAPTEFKIEEYQEFQRARKQYATLDECERVCRVYTEKFLRIVDGLSDEDLEIEVRLPFAPEVPRTLADIAGMHSWNLSYHTAQIAYIQTLLGDSEMH